MTVYMPNRRVTDATEAFKNPQLKAGVQGCRY